MLLDLVIIGLVLLCASTMSLLTIGSKSENTNNMIVNYFKEHPRRFDAGFQLILFTISVLLYISLFQNFSPGENFTEFVVKMCLMFAWPVVILLALDRFEKISYTLGNSYEREYNPLFIITLTLFGYIGTIISLSIGTFRGVNLPFILVGWFGMFLFFPRLSDISSKLSPQSIEENIEKREFNRIHYATVALFIWVSAIALFLIGIAFIFLTGESFVPGSALGIIVVMIPLRKTLAIARGQEDT